MWEEEESICAFIGTGFGEFFLISIFFFFLTEPKFEDRQLLTEEPNFSHLLGSGKKKKESDLKKRGSEHVLWQLRLRYFMEFRVGKFLLCKDPS